MRVLSIKEVHVPVAIDVGEGHRAGSSMAPVVKPAER
jgi:hypothetical protein